MRQRDHQSGFSALVVSFIVLAVSALAVTGLVVYKHQKPSSAKYSAAVSQSQTNTQPQAMTTAQTQQPTAKPAYASWPVYNNTKYGLSVNYPTDWTVSNEVIVNPQTSATRQVFGASLKLRTDTKYNDTAAFEVLDEPLQTAATWYDQYYAQTSIKVNKTQATLKGKQTVQYEFVAPTYKSKRYLLAVGTRTFVFSSVNEALNVQNDANYWSNFDNTFTSLTIR